MVEEAELWVRSAGGAEVCLLATALPLTAGSGAWIGARGVCRDITRLRCHEAELAEARNRERLFSYIVNMVRRELDPARMLDATAEALLQIGRTSCRERGGQDGEVSVVAVA